MAPLRIEGDKAEPRKRERVPRSIRRFCEEWHRTVLASQQERELQEARTGFAPGTLRLVGVDRQPDGSNVVRFETVPCPPAGW